MLSRFEMARVVGLRAMQLAEGEAPLVHSIDESLRCDYTYVAALELYARKLDACVRRDDGTVVHVSSLRPPPDLASMLDTRDGGARFYASRSSH